ncbi:hypothetical protein BDW74DRAFT_176202 [Aspergillus multicolor]|uniref:uncharacterized protein n=1 Tax=Aspergillus multicolor TaxID=41759 RepID=UPI003CCE527A
MSSATDKAGLEGKDVQFALVCLKNIREGKVNLSGVGDELGYTDVESVANRFRALRKKYGFTGLECATSTSAKARPSKRKAAATAPAAKRASAKGTGRGRKKAAEPVANAEGETGESAEEADDRVAVKDESDDTA